MDLESKHTTQLNLWIPRQARNDDRRGVMKKHYPSPCPLPGGTCFWLPQGARGQNRTLTGIFLVLLLFLLLPALSLAAGPASKKVTFLQKNGKPGPCTFTVEMAITPAEQERGLMFREHMDAEAGMLFDFWSDEMRYFWMRNTLIPLDMIFIGSDMKVVHVHPKARPRDETSISSKFPARYVLEINGGRAAACRIGPGSRARIINPSP